MIVKRRDNFFTEVNYLLLNDENQNQDPPKPLTKVYLKYVTEC